MVIKAGVFCSILIHPVILSDDHVYNFPGNQSTIYIATATFEPTTNTTAETTMALSTMSGRVFCTVHLNPE